MSAELIKIDSKDLVRQSTDIAGLCKEIVVNTACRIQGKSYVKVEGWQAIATAHGCVASARDVKRIDGGIVAIGEIKRMSDGMVLSTAEGFVGDDEKTWGNRDEYAKRAMAQTRAISRACRSAFAHVVVLMNAGLETTPAEEIPADGFDNAKPVNTPPKPAPRQAPPVTNNYLNEQDPFINPESVLKGDEEELVGIVEDVKLISGTGKNGKPYTIYKIHLNDGEQDDKVIDTFSDTFGNKAISCKGQEVKIWCHTKQNGKYTNRDLVLLKVEDTIPF